MNSVIALYVVRDARTVKIEISCVYLNADERMACTALYMNANFQQTFKICMHVAFGRESEAKWGIFVKTKHNSRLISLNKDYLC